MAFDINLDTSKAHAKLKNLGVELTGISTQIKKINAEGLTFAKVGGSAKELKSQATTGSVGLQNLTRSVVQLKAQTDTVNQGITHLNKQFHTFSQRSITARNNLGKVRVSMNNTAKEAAALRAGMYATGTHFGAFTAQTILAATATYAVVRSFVAMIAVGAEFEQSMARANAVMGNFDNAGRLNIENAKKLEGEVRRLGENTVFTVSEVSEGLVFLGMAGLNTQEAMKALEPTLNIASIGMIEMARAADIATNIMLGFDKQAGDLADIVDVMAVAITSSNMDMEQLGNSLSYVAPVAQSTNNSLRDTVAILELFHNVGIKSSRAGTSLRRALINLSKPTDKVQAILTKLNISLFDQENKMKPLLNIMRQFANANAEVSDILTIFGARAGPAMLKLYSDIQKEVDGGASSVQRFRDELEASTGKAEGLRDNIEDVLAADWKKLISALSELALKVFKEVGPLLRDMVKGVTDFVKALDAGSVATFTKAVGGLLAVKYLLVPQLTKTAAALVAVTAVTGKTVIAMRGLALIMGFMTGPAGWIALAAGIGIYIASQNRSTKAVEASVKAYEREAAEVERLAKFKRDLDDINLNELNTRLKISDVDLAMAKAKGDALVAGGAEFEIAMNLKRAKDQMAKVTQDLASADAKTAQSARDQLVIAGKALEIAKRRRAENAAEVDSIGRIITAREAENKILKEAAGIRNKAAADIIKEKKAAIDAAKAAAPVEFKTLLAEEKLLTQEQINRVKLAEQMGEISKIGASKERIAILQEEARVVQNDLDVRIAKQKALFKVASDALDSIRKDPNSGRKTADPAIEEFENRRKALEKLQKTEKDYKRSINQRIQAEKEGQLKSGAQVSQSLKSAWQLEGESYDRRLEQLKAFHKQAGIIGQEAADKEQQLSIQSWANKAEIVLGGMSRIVGTLSKMSDIQFQMSAEEAQKGYDLYQESLSRQEDFAEAAKNAQTAGDQAYYATIANQYKAYTAQYKKQFEEQDAIARKNFEKKKKYQIAETIINTASAVMVGYRQLGPIAGSIAAAATIALGATMISQIQAQEYQSPSGSLAGGSFGGLPEAPTDTASSIADTPTTDGQANALNIYIEGAITEDMINDVVIPVIQDGISERDIILISGTGEDTAQLSEVSRI